MRGLAIGSSGDDVARVFGPATQAAVLAFHRSEGLVDALRHALIENDLKRTQACERRSTRPGPFYRRL